MARDCDWSLLPLRFCCEASAVSSLAAAVFGVPTGVIGSGFEDAIENHRSSDGEIGGEDGYLTKGYVAPENTTRGKLYNFLHAMNILPRNEKIFETTD